MPDDHARFGFRLIKLDLDVVLTPLYVREEVVAELVLGREARLWRPELVRRLEREGLPPQRQLLGTMRYLPSVFNFFAKREGVQRRSEYEPDDGPENFGSM